MTDMGNLDHETCSAWLNQSFRLELEDVDTLELVLESVNLLGAHDPDRSTRAPFALEFSGPLEPVLEQHIYQLEGDSGLSLELFLVPVGPQQDRQRYEAVFT